MTRPIHAIDYCGAAWRGGPRAVACTSANPLPDPADATVAVPDITVTSAFDGYRPYRDDEGPGWKQLNRDVMARPAEPCDRRRGQRRHAFEARRRRAMTMLAISPRIGAAAAVLAFLAGCTTFSKDGGFDAVSSAASARIRERRGRGQDRRRPRSRRQAHEGAACKAAVDGRRGAGRAAEQPRAAGFVCRTGAVGADLVQPAGCRTRASRSAAPVPATAS